MFQIAININELLYKDLIAETLGDRIKKAKLILGLNQHELAKKVGLSRSTINELECGLRDNITIDTLTKLISVLDPNIILDDYLIFILNQKEIITDLINKYGKKRLSEILQCHISTVERYANNTYQFPKNKFDFLKPYI